MHSGHPEGRISLGELAQARKRLQESLGELHLQRHRLKKSLAELRESFVRIRTGTYDAGETTAIIIRSEVFMYRRMLRVPASGLHLTHRQPKFRVELGAESYTDGLHNAENRQGRCQNNVVRRGLAPNFGAAVSQYQTLRAHFSYVCEQPCQSLGEDLRSLTRRSQFCCITNYGLLG